MFLYTHVCMCILYKCQDIHEHVQFSLNMCTYYILNVYIYNIIYIYKCLHMYTCIYAHASVHIVYTSECVYVHIGKVLVVHVRAVCSDTYNIIMYVHVCIHCLLYMSVQA